MGDLNADASPQSTPPISSSAHSISRQTVKNDENVVYSRSERVVGAERYAASIAARVRACVGHARLPEDRRRRNCHSRREIHRAKKPERSRPKKNRKIERRSKNGFKTAGGGGGGVFTFGPCHLRLRTVVPSFTWRSATAERRVRERITHSCVKISFFDSYRAHSRHTHTHTHARRILAERDGLADYII